MLSVREVLSSDWVRRYSEAGIEIVDYRTVEGKVKAPKGKILVI
jgi:hypothetical protein